MTDERGHKEGLVSLGIYPESARDLVNLELRSQRQPITPDRWGAKRAALLETVRWLKDRGGELCDFDIKQAERDVVAGELWNTADYLLHILEEYLPEEEKDEKCFLLRAGIEEKSADLLVAERRSRQEYLTILALELGILAASAGLRGDNMRALLRGKKIRDSARKGYEEHIAPKHRARRAAWKRWQSVVNEVRKDYPGISSAHLWRIASRRLTTKGETGCSPRSVKRRCKDPAPAHPRKKN